MTVDAPEKCPECGSTELVETDDEVVCESCGLTLDADDPVSDDSDIHDEVEWTAFEQDESSDADDEPEWRQSFREQREKREQRREARERERERQQAALDDAPTLPIAWTAPDRRLIGSLGDLAILYDEESLYGLDLQSGDDVWETSMPTLVDEWFQDDIERLSASFMDWRVRLGRESIYVRPSKDEILALSADDGRLQWDRTTAFEHSGRSVLTDESLYVTNEYGALTALSLDDGNVEWTADALIDDASWQSWFPASPVVCGGLVVTATNSDDGLVAARDRDSGDLVWQFPMRETPSVLTASGGDLFAGTVRGDAYAIDTDDGSQRWRHRLTEFGDREDPNEKTRPTESVLGIERAGSLVVVTGSGYYSSVVDADDGSQSFELLAAGSDDRFGTLDATFHHPSTVATDGTTFTHSGSVIQRYQFDTAASVEEARDWTFEATDTLRARPTLSTNEDYLLATDDSERVCLLESESGDPVYTCELDDTAKRFVPTPDRLLVDTRTTVYAVESR
ncbi:PQQ-binding-like beta-propeller repeat protein [Haloplanus sp. C73]|uniref:outer membrane protein assembly factor BamB family protein n=1 Tax=Haloplanus sp. C73 TaxID=3421641 RepID=UPI003EBF369C